MASERTDIVVEDHGSIVILRGVSDAGRDWIEEHVSAEGYQPFGHGARLCERRYVTPVIKAMREAGLVLEVR